MHNKPSQFKLATDFLKTEVENNDDPADEVYRPEDVDNDVDVEDPEYILPAATTTINPWIRTGTSDHKRETAVLDLIEANEERQKVVLCKENHLLDLKMKLLHRQLDQAGVEYEKQNFDDSLFH